MKNLVRGTISVLLMGIGLSYFGLVGLMVSALILGFAAADLMLRRNNAALVVLGPGVLACLVAPPEILTTLLGPGWGVILALCAYLVFAAIGCLLRNSVTA